MNIHAQFRTLEELILNDVTEIASLTAEMHEVEEEEEASSIEEQTPYLKSLKVSLVLLCQGVEGLRLKQDSLMDRAKTQPRELFYI